MKSKRIPSSQSQSQSPFTANIDEDDDFHDPFHSQLSRRKSASTVTSSQLLKPSNISARPSKKLKQQPGKENCFLPPPTESADASFCPNQIYESDIGLECIESTIDCGVRSLTSVHEEEEDVKLKEKSGYTRNSIEYRLLNSKDEIQSDAAEAELDSLLKLCGEMDEDEREVGDATICCPLCGADISDLSEELRQVHTNECLDKEDNPPQVLDGSVVQSPLKAANVSPVVEWLRNLGLGRYEETFIREEIDWDALQRLTEADLYSIGITALGPRKKIVHALDELRKDSSKEAEFCEIVSKAAANDIGNLRSNKLITDYFPGSVSARRKGSLGPSGQSEAMRRLRDPGNKIAQKKVKVKIAKSRNVPLWCCIPGTPFRVDAFKYLRGDCSHWFLTHFHMDHYQGLTKSFCHGKIYCSIITAKLVNLKMGVQWDKLEVLPLNQKISIAGIDVTCFDANHCPGAIIILFEPPNDKAVLHTGDFRFCEEMARISILQTSRIQTLILDTTYCDPQYDFPKQEAVIQFVIEAIQAETFNPKTLFLIGSYSIGKERLFMEVARTFRKKIYITPSKLRLLKCLGFPEDDMQYLTTNEQESHIHVVPMWTIASFKRLKHVSNQYMGRYNLIVAFSPTGWSFGKGKKKSPGRRWKQGTIIRYEVPYSEHSSFSELREFVKFLSPVNIIPSVNNHGPESSSAMVSRLLAESVD